MSISVLRPCFMGNLSSPLYRNLHHCVMIGGGVTGKTVSRVVLDHASEYTEYLTLKYLIEKFKGFQPSHPDSPRVLFGNGKSFTLKKDPRILASLYFRLTNQPNEVSEQPLENLKGDASLISISSEFDDLTKKIQRGDKLTIYLTGHGSMFRGTLLWNERFTTQYLSSTFLQKQIKKLPSDIHVRLIVDSCYSGHYLKLSSSSVSVLTTSTD